MDGFFSAGGYTILICLQYIWLFAATYTSFTEVKILRQFPGLSGDPMVVLVLCLTLLALLTFLQWQVPSNAAVDAIPLPSSSCWYLLVRFCALGRTCRS